MRSKPIDYDALLKEFISDFFPDFIAFVNPALYDAIDWEKGYVFLEQELINALRGKFKIKGKSKRTDKLVKVVLKEGKEHFVFVHIEFQHKPEKGFARRMYIYRTLICLRYDIDDISAIAIFTANPPPEEEKSYRNDTFGTSIIYTFKTLVAADLQEEVLIQASHNPFAIAMLAALYTYRSRNKPRLRLLLKAKLFALVRAKGAPVEKIVQLLIFVRDFVHLPEHFEHEFQFNQYLLTFPNENAMTISKGTKEFALGMFEHVFGYNPNVALAEEREKLAKERQQAEVERLQLLEALQYEEKEREKIEQERRQLLDATIFNLHHIAKMSAAEIALIVNLEPEAVEVIIANHL